jgi:hypothetical protein
VVAAPGLQRGKEAEGGRAEHGWRAAGASCPWAAQPVPIKLPAPTLHALLSWASQPDLQFNTNPVSNTALPPPP